MMFPSRDLSLRILLLLSMLALAENAIIPGNIIKKPGECPIVQNMADIECPIPPSVHNTVEFNSYLLTIAGCLFDADCVGEERCCFDGCKTKCIPVDVPKSDNIKQNKCPVVKKTDPTECDYVDDPLLKRGCQTDNDCKDIEACCFDGCQTACVQISEKDKITAKEGICPSTSSGYENSCSESNLEGKSATSNLDECQNDVECNGTKKCCKDGCKMKCIEPLIAHKINEKRGETWYANTETAATKMAIEDDKLMNNQSGESRWSIFKERAFVMIKPEGIKNGFVSEIIGRFEKVGYDLVGMKLLEPSKELLRKHYLLLNLTSLLDDMMEYVGPGPVVAMVWQGLRAIEGAKNILSTKRSAGPKFGTSRDVLQTEFGREIVYSSNSISQSAQEIKLWFTKNEIIDW